MRRLTLGWVLSVAVLLPSIGTAQVLVRPNPYPATTAASAAWQLRGEPVFHAGSFYYPTGPSVFFDGNVMARTGTYEGVPLYEDGTLTPFTIVYVPIGGNVVRPYERRREGDLAGTVGSRPPSFASRYEAPVDARAPGNSTQMVDGFVPVIPEALRPIGTAGSVVVRPVGPSAAASIARGARAAVPAVLQIWVPYDGARWVSAGPAVPYTAERFVQVGEHRGFPVYQERTGGGDQIYIPSVAGGPVAPYKKE
jgi:hypothetical protein